MLLVFIFLLLLLMNLSLILTVQRFLLWFNTINNIIDNFINFHIVVVVVGFFCSMSSSCGGDVLRLSDYFLSELSSILSLLNIDLSGLIEKFLAFLISNLAVWTLGSG